MALRTFLIISILVGVHNCDVSFSSQPEQIHISFGNNTRDIVITWSTFDPTPDSSVEYGIDGLTNTAIGYSTRFVDGGSLKHTQYIHRVLLTDLAPNTRYFYHCGSSLGWSPVFWFNTVPDDDDWSPRLAIFGDMGYKNAMALVHLQEETQKGLYDAIIHVGDFAYDLHGENARIGDGFMNQIESVAGYVPYMVCAGNHENNYNFSHYRNRFSMPGNHENIMYSFDLGPVHFIIISTEVYYYLNYGLKSVALQYDWLEEDLKNANKNRHKTPWIVVVGHRPMYCSNSIKEKDCTNRDNLIRVGLPLFQAFGLEELFYNQGVDVMIWAHEHAYERLWPIYDYKIYNGSYENPYVNPTAPVHITTGSAGCDDPITTFPAPSDIAEWSAFHNQDYGYMRMKAQNKTHLYFEYVSEYKKGVVIDQFWIVKEKHGKYPERPFLSKNHHKQSLGQENNITDHIRLID